jgi:hypothetical protein
MQLGLKLLQEYPQPKQRILQHSLVNLPEQRQGVQVLQVVKRQRPASRLFLLQKLRTLQ